MSGAVHRNLSLSIVDHLFSDNKLHLLIENFCRAISSGSKQIKQFYRLATPLATTSRTLAGRTQTTPTTSGQYEWASLPMLHIPASKKGVRELELSDFISKICTVFQKFAKISHNSDKDRAWTSAFHSLPLHADSGIERMPNIIGLKMKSIKNCCLIKTMETRLRWEHIDVLIELTCGDHGSFEELHNELANKAFCMFQSQLHHCFVCCLCLK